MTAVVGILNKHAIALAADSAVTIGDGKSRKILNKANKVFTLSKHHPVGVMIYNSASFMGTPWETIIKMYRKQLLDTDFPTVKAYQEDFVEYLRKKQFFTNDHTQKQFLYTFTSFIVDTLLNEIKESQPILFDTSTQENKVEILNLFSEKCNIYADQFAQNQDLCQELNDLSEDEFNNFIEQPFQELIQKKFTDYEFHISQESVLALKRLVYSYIRIKENLSPIYTGLIFCGFGEEELFPQLIPLNVSIVVLNKLRYYIDEKNAASISNDNEGAICPFAQIDVINTILTGIDPTLDTTYLENFEAAFTKYNEVILELIGEGSPEISAQIKALDVKELGKEYMKKNEETKQSNYINPLMNAVSSLSKEDLAEMAESLIYLTYLKRRITFAEESVGGPVDVAIISKGDGFIWIKRKHYFKPELNQYFLDNYFNT